MLVTNVLSRQTCVCRDKTFVTSILLYKYFSRQFYFFFFFCRDKRRDKRRLLSRQTRICHDKSFIPTKMILVAAPANDIIPTLGTLTLYSLPRAKADIFKTSIPLCLISIEKTASYSQILPLIQLPQPFKRKFRVHPETVT